MIGELSFLLTQCVSCVEQSFVVAKKFRPSQSKEEAISCKKEFFVFESDKNPL